MKSKIFTGLLLSVVAVLATQTVVSLPENREALNLTIYNNNRALVQEIRQISLPAGVSNVRFEGVAQSIIPQSLIVSGGGFRVLEQNYEFDLISREALLNKFVGREITLIDQNGVLTGNGNIARVPARLIANNFQPIFEVDGKIVLGFEGQILLPELPENLFARPTLKWLVQAQRAANVKADVSYLTEGFSWNADYVMLLADNEKNASITAWITLTNQSGAAFENANLRLIAGDVNMVAPQNQMMRQARMVMSAPMMAEDFGGGVEQRSFDEFHLYSIARPVSIRENQTKQIEMFSAPQINVQRRYRVRSGQSFPQPVSRRGGGAAQDGEMGVRHDVVSEITFQTGQRNNLNLPFPRGVVRIYRKDGDKNVFDGEDNVSHTPINEHITLRSGTAFDITCFVRTTAQRQVNDRRSEFTKEVSISNHKRENITVLFEEIIHGNWTIRSNQRHTQVDANTARFEVAVRAGQTTTFAFTATVDR
ncbi:MAG: hypothetical protein FWE23_04370 [Chitinivibrionia bacterium]|nr:hypothetical protein [Chitinivibrionia bacterium]